MYLIQEMKNIIFMAVLFSDKQLKIYDYNRVIKDLNGLSGSDFIAKLKNSFISLMSLLNQFVQPIKESFPFTWMVSGIASPVPQETYQRTQRKI